MLPLVAFHTGGETVHQRPSQQPARGETGHVLVLDQDRAVAAAVTDLLRTHGLAVERVRTELEALQRLSALPEGDLSRVRANLVKQETLHQLALRLKISDVLRLGEGESKSGGQQRPSILADALEALIGAVYLDAGYASAEALVHRLFQGVEINPQMQAASKDAKTALQEWLQGRKMKLPQYKVVGTVGAAHRQTFDVECDIPELGLTERGIGGSRRAGEQAAAAAMLATLKAKKL